MMKLTRRKLLAGIGISASGYGLSTGINLGWSQSVNVDYSGMTTSDKPLVKNEQLSLDDKSAFPNYYKSLVTSNDQLRWNYLREEDAALANDMKQTNWDSEILAVFGMVLPRNKGFNSNGVSLKDRTLTMELILEDRPSTSSALTIMNQVTRVENIKETPDDFEVSVTY
ncbi:hypothetical protein BRC82_02870 [Halobacteriales archaeon QS_1_67_19]|nr:MAG: hypothetical protein BRC82_02870 [Halobacteriales archaeon QS_1_67_19]